MTARPYDVVIVGTGSAARGVASRCRAAGRSVAIIDSRPFGGTYLFALAVRRGLTGAELLDAP